MPDAPADFEDLFRDEYPGVLAACVRITGDRSRGEDAAQEAFARLFARWTRLRHYDRPGAWVRRVAIREAVRVAQRDDRRSDLEAIARNGLPEDEWSGGIDAQVDVAAVFAALAPRQRAAAQLVWIDDRPVAEAARVLRCRPATVRVHLHRARRALSGELDRSDGASPVLSEEPT